MVRQDKKRSCWISPINLLRALLTTANVQRFSEVESQLLTTGQVTHSPDRIGYALASCRKTGFYEKVTNVKADVAAVLV